MNLGIDRLAASSGSHCRTATTLSVPALCPARPAISTPFATNCRQTLGTISLASLGFTRDGWMDGWMNGVRSPPRTAVCIHPLLPLPPHFLSLSHPVSFGFLSDYSPSERRANNNPAMTCSLGRPPPILLSFLSLRRSPFRRDERERATRQSNERPT